jgi:hypothetical protein
MKKDKFFHPDTVVEDLPLYGNQFLPLGIKATIQESRKNNFPWEYRNQTVDFSFVYTGNEDYTLQAFEQFVEFMRRFESYLREYLLSKGIKAEGDILPIGFYGLLEYEFFRQILSTMKEIQVSFAEPKVMVGNGNAFVMMALVKGKDNDNLEISDVVQWE